MCICASSDTCDMADHAKMHSHTHTHTHKSYYICRSKHGVVEIKGAQGVIWYLGLLHAHALDSHQRHVPHFQLCPGILTTVSHHWCCWDLFPLCWLRECVCFCVYMQVWVVVDGKYKNCTDLRLYMHLGVSVSAWVFRIGEKVVKQWRQRGHCLLRESESEPCGREIEGGRGLLLVVLY